MPQFDMMAGPDELSYGEAIHLVRLASGECRELENLINLYMTDGGLTSDQIEVVRAKVHRACRSLVKLANKVGQR
jgi:hypothetical protein